MKQARLLVSVRDAREAEEALAGGAEWIDLKEPQRGALGAVEAATAREVAGVVAGRAPLSAAAGELAEWPTARSRELLEVAGVTHLKLGFADCAGRPWERWWRHAQREAAAAGKQLAPAAYADHDAARAPCPAAIIESTAAGSNWALIDTFDKDGGALHELWPTERGELEAFLRRVRATGRQSAVAGKLDGAAIARLPWDLVDMAAVRGAACRGSRESVVCRDCVANLARIVRESSRACARLMR